MRTSFPGRPSLGGGPRLGFALFWLRVHREESFHPRPCHQEPADGAMWFSCPSQSQQDYELRVEQAKQPGSCGSRCGTGVRGQAAHPQGQVEKTADAGTRWDGHEMGQAENGRGKPAMRGPRADLQRPLQTTGETPAAKLSLCACISFLWLYNKSPKT